MDRSHAMKNLDKKEKDLVYMQRDCAQHRESFWDAICESMTKQGKQCYHAGMCNGNHHLGIKYEPVSLRSGNFLTGAVDTYAPFKVAVSIEKELNDYGYMSEKIVLPLLAGTIPIYSGAKHITDVFDREAFVQVDWQSPSTTISEVQRLMDDPGMYKAMVSRPAVQPKAFRNYFTWHSSTFGKYGDELRRRIIESILDVC